MPNMELKNWAKSMYPACSSVRDHRDDRAGSMGPRKVITIPVSRKSRWTRAVPLVAIGSLEGLGRELMIYDECKSAGFPDMLREINA